MAVEWLQCCSLGQVPSLSWAILPAQQNHGVWDSLTDQKFLVECTFCHNGTSYFSVVLTKRHGQKQLLEEEFVAVYSSRGRVQNGCRKLRARNSIHRQEVKGANSKWGKAMKAYPPITYFLQQNCTSFLNIATNWDKVFKHWSLWGDISHPSYHNDLLRSGSRDTGMVGSALHYGISVALAGKIILLHFT